MSNLPSAQPKRPLPAIDDLYADVEQAAKLNELNRLLNCNPKPEWIKTNPFAQNSKYIPIGIIEYLLVAIFIEYNVEVKETKLIANSVTVTVRVYVTNPVTGREMWQDGIGAAPLKTAKGAKATDFENILDSSVQTGAPAAESYAIKDACEKWGRIFGKDLNRKEENTMSYAGLESKLADNRPKAGDIPDELKAVIAEADAENLATIYKANPEYHNIPLFMQLLGARQVQLKAQKNAANNQPSGVQH
jgi:hypothetical protein